LHGAAGVVPQIDDQTLEIRASQLLDGLLHQLAGGAFESFDTQITDAGPNFKGAIDAGGIH
jgi:hypothetical protein